MKQLGLALDFSNGAFVPVERPYIKVSKATSLGGLKVEAVNTDKFIGVPRTVKIGFQGYSILFGIRKGKVGVYPVDKWPKDSHGEWPKIPDAAYWPMAKKAKEVLLEKRSVIGKPVMA